MAIKSIDNYIVDMFSQMRGISVQGIKNFATNLKPATNKDIIAQMKVQTDVMEKSAKNSASLLKAFDGFMKQQQEQAQLRSNASTANSTDSKPSVFEQKDKVQQAIVGQKNPLLGVITSIKSDTSRIVELLEQSARLEKENSNKGSRFGSGFDMGGLLKYWPLLALATASAPELGSGLHAGASLLPTAGRLAKGAGTAISAGAGALRAGGGIANAWNTARQAGATAGGMNARNLLIGQQKIGTLGKIGAIAGAGATYGRYSQGDEVGATVQGISTALPLLLSKTKYGKIASLASGIMDVGLLGRDYLNKDKTVTEDEATKQEQDAQLAPTNAIASNTAETNKILTDIATGKIGQPSQVSSSGAGSALGLGAMALLGGGILARKTPFGALTGGFAGSLGRNAGAGALGSLGGLFGRGAGATAGVAGAGATAGANAGLGALNPALKVGGKALGKTALKSLPFIGLAMGAYGAYGKVQEGDYKGAVLEATSGIAAMIPVYGTAISLGLQGISATRDVMRATNKETMDAVTANNQSVTSNITSANDMSNSQISRATDSTTSALMDANALTNKNIADTSAMANGSIANTAQTLSTTGSTLSSNLISASTSFLGMISKFTLLGIGMTTTGMAIDAVGNYFKTDKEKLQTKLGQGDVSGLHLGAVAEAFESGGKGVGTVSGGQGDKGGVSYGKHQLSSKSGTMKEFLNSKHGEKYRADLGKYEIGSDQFNATYKTIAKFKGDEFAKDQKAFIDQTHFGVQANAIKSRTGIDVKKRGRAISELIYSMSVQYRNLTPSIFEKALGKNANQLSDKEIIERVMDYRLNNVNSHFSGSNDATRKAVGGRIKTEKDMLLNIQSKNPNAITGVAGASGDTNGTSSGSIAKSSAKTTSANKIDKGSNPQAKSADYDLDKICAYAYSKAGAKSQRKCALFVRQALQQGDNKGQIKGGLGDANQWNKNLPKVGFVQVGGTNAQKGDIAWFPPYEGSKEGHVCIFTGSQWVSDFKQKSVQPNSAKNLPYVLFRAKSGYSNGSTTGATEGEDQLQQGAEGLSAGAEGSETPDSLFQQTYDAVTTGIAGIFNSDAMQRAKDFMKGDIYKTGDKTPMPKAQGTFTKDVDQYDPNRKLVGSGQNGEADDLSFALGGDEILRQQRHANYENVKRAIGGSNDIYRQERPDNYDEVKNAIGGSNQIKRQMGGKSKNKWWLGLFDSLLGGNDFLGGLFGLATGQRKLSDITPQEILGQVQGAIGKGGIFEGGQFNGRALGKMIGLDASGALNDIANGGFGGGFGGGLSTNISSAPSGAFGGGFGGGLTQNTTGDTTGDTTYNTGGTTFASKLGSVLGIPRMEMGSYAFGGGFGGGLARNSGNISAEENISENTYDRMQDYERFAGRDIDYDHTERMDEEREMQIAKYNVEEDKRQQAQVQVNIPQTSETPTGTNPRGKTPQDGLGAPMTVKNPDTVIHAVAVGMMGNSV